MRIVLAIVAIAILALSLLLANYIQDLPALKFAVPSADEVKKLDWTSIVLQALCLLLGICFSYFYKRFSDLRTKGVQEVDIALEARGFFRSTNFWLALAASPVLFGVVIALTGQLPLGTALFIAFQNGFFWEQIMPQKPQQLPAGP